MPIFETFYCSKEKKNIVKCIEKVILNIEKNRIDEITCRHWKKKIGCTFNSKEAKK